MKIIGIVVGQVRAFPTFVFYLLSSITVGREKAFQRAAERASLISGSVGVYARSALYKRLLTHVGKNVYIGHLSVFTKPDSTIADDVYIGRNCSLGLVDIESGVLIADRVNILSGAHQHPKENRSGGSERIQEFTRIGIGRDCWIGAGSIIMASIEANVTIGAGAVVTKPCSAGNTFIGVPARRLSDHAL